jgi:gas vesicle protein
MIKAINFMAGIICGALVGAVTALLLAPSSGQQLRSDVISRWEEALTEAKVAMEETRRQMQEQFEQMQKGESKEEVE